MTSVKTDKRAARSIIEGILTPIRTIHCRIFINSLMDLSIYTENSGIRFKSRGIRIQRQIDLSIYIYIWRIRFKSRGIHIQRQLPNVVLTHCNWYNKGKDICETFLIRTRTWRYQSSITPSFLQMSSLLSFPLGFPFLL